MKKTLKKYGKKQIKEKVHKFWSKEIKEDAENKSTLLHLNPNPSFGKLHISIAIIDNAMMIRRANIKMRLLTGTYSLQTVRAHVYKQIPSAICLLCKESDETKEHFIIECPVLSSIRTNNLPVIFSKIPFVLRNKPCHQ